MSVLLSVIILVLIVFILDSLQLVPGIFSIFYHSALGKNTRNKTDDLSLGFIFGTEIFVAIFFATMYSVFSFIFLNGGSCNQILLFILAGILFAEGLAFLLFYYRRGKGTALFIPRSIAKNISNKTIKTRSDAILLGLFAGVPELLFTLPLYIVATIALLNVPNFSACLVIISYILLTTIPLFIIRTAYRAGRNLAEIERFRIKIKPFIRILIPLAYFAIASIIIQIGLANG